MQYYKTRNTKIILFIDNDGNRIFVSVDESNRLYKNYLEWVAQDNIIKEESEIPE